MDEGLPGFAGSWAKNGGKEMTLTQIKAAIHSGRKVHWGNLGYEVFQDCIGQYLICCLFNNYCWGLTYLDGETLNGAEEEFFTEDK